MFCPKQVLSNITERGTIAAMQHCSKVALQQCSTAAMPILAFNKDQK